MVPIQSMWTCINTMRAVVNNSQEDKRETPIWMVAVIYIMVAAATIVTIVSLFITA